MNDRSRNKPNYYLILDVVPGVTHNEILHAYNRAKNTYSSGSLASYSLLEDEASSTILEDIESAYATLGNPARRREYDVEMNFPTWTDDSVSAATLANIVASPHSATVTSPQPSQTSSSESVSIGTASSAAASSRLIPNVKKSSEAEQKIIPTATITNLSSLKTSTLSTPKATIPPLPSASQFEANPEFEEKIKSCEHIDGAFLKAVRIYKRYSQDSVAQRCKLSASHVEIVEEEDASRFYQPVYLRGHIVLICQVLGLPDPDKLAKSYIEKMMELGKIAKRGF